MASADNLLAMDNSWMFGNAYPETWFQETFSRETETLTKALQKSFETTQCFDNINFSNDFVSPWYLTNNNNNSNNNNNYGSDTATTVSGENNSASTTTTTTVVVTSRKRSIGGGGGGGGKIVKRKSRASKRATTTFINADVGNFRQLVQEVTGVKFGGGEVVKPEALRGVSRLQMIGGGGGLPTLDTSAFLLDPTHRSNEQMVVGGGAPPAEVALDGGAAGSRSQFDFDSFCSFPTLESWKAV